MNGAVFKGLNHLAKVFLKDNQCIHDEFLEFIKLATLTDTVSSLCGFTENAIELINPPSGPGNSETCGKILEGFCNTTAADNQRLQTEIAAKTAENSLQSIKVTQLEGQISLVESNAKNVMKIVTQLYERIEAKLDQTCLTAESVMCQSGDENLQELLQKKTQVIEELLGERQRNLAEINEKNKEIVILKEKIETCVYCVFNDLPIPPTLL